MTVLVLSGCAQPTVPIEPVTIAFAYPEPDGPYYEPLAQIFSEQHPYVTVELLPQPIFEQSTLAAHATDVIAGDMLLLSGFRDGLLSLDPFIEGDAFFDWAEFYPGPARLFVSQGETWAIPAGLDMYVMYYSQDLFDQYGVPYPQTGWTWAEFLDRALALTDVEAGIYGYSTTPEHSDAALFVYGHGGRVVDNIQDPTRTTFDEPLTVEALEWYANLFHEYDVAPTSLEASRAFGGGRYATYQGIRNGRVGMWILTLSERGGLVWPVEWNMTWHMVDLPSDTEPVTPVWAEGYAISSATQHPDVCWAWLAFLTRHMHHRLVPARRSLAESEAYEKLVGEEMATVVRTSLEHAVPYSPEIWTDFGDAMTGFGQAVNDIIEGKETVWEAMSRAQEQSER